MLNNSPNNIKAIQKYFCTFDALFFKHYFAESDVLFVQSDSQSSDMMRFI